MGSDSFLLLSSDNCRRVVHVHVPLSPSYVIWCWSWGSSWEGDSDLALHWPCIIDLMVYPTTGSVA